MTPAEKLGYKVGDEFEVVSKCEGPHYHGFDEGDLLRLTHDCGSDRPLFERLDGRGQYMFLREVKPLSRITLARGDYIATADLSEDDYHNVARAFMAAGADENEYDEDDDMPKCWALFGWDEDEGLTHWDSVGSFGFNPRPLTLSQILNATNAGNIAHAETTTEPTTETTPMHLTDRLEAARASLEQAQGEYDALLEEHKAAYPKLHGLSVHVDVPPEEWRAGDVLMCYAGGCDFTEGNEYTIADDGEGVHDDDGDYRRIGIFMDQLKFHSRP